MIPSQRTCIRQLLPFLPNIQFRSNLTKQNSLCCQINAGPNLAFLFCPGPDLRKNLGGGAGEAKASLLMLHYVWLIWMFGPIIKLWKLRSEMLLFFSYMCVFKIMLFEVFILFSLCLFQVSTESRLSFRESPSMYKLLELVTRPVQQAVAVLLN